MSGNRNLTPLIAKDTPADSGIFHFGREHANCSIVVDGTLGASEVISIVYLGMNGTDETVAYNNNEEVATLTLTRPSWAIESACSIKVSKTSTANAVGVAIAGL